MSEFEPIIETIKADKNLPVLHQHLTLTPMETRPAFTNSTCAVPCTFYNSRFTMVIPPYKPISRIIQIDEDSVL